MSELATLSDAELVRRCRAGDPEAWNELVERFSRYVYAICRQGFRLSDEDAEDVFQDVFTRVYTRLETLRDDSRAAAVDRAAHAPALPRRALGRGREQPTEEPHRRGEPRTCSPRSTRRSTCARRSPSFPEHCQEILDRFFARDESYRTISAELELPSGTIASRIARCLGEAP